MISKFKSLETGIKRAIIVAGIFLPFFLGGIITGFDYQGEWVGIAIFIILPIYWILALAGLWIYDGFEKNEDQKNEGKFQSKNEIIKHLIRKRLLENPELNLNESKVNSLQGMRLAGMPESTIVAIVELYAKLKEADISDKEIFQQFEQMRSGSGKLPSPLNLDSYINYRLRLEHQDGIGLTDEFTSESIKICSSHYNV